MTIGRRDLVKAGAVAGAAALTGCASVSSAFEPTDPLFTQPFIDADEWRDQPVRHRYVHGGFTGTNLKFSMYFPPAEQYQGRFFHPVMHIAGNENAAYGRLGGLDGDIIGFSFASGGYLVESNQGSTMMAGPNEVRASAATAQYSRYLAQQMYGGDRPYGYVFGGSGGAFKSTACAEQTDGVWDGALPFIPGCPISMPNVFTVQAQALRILDGKWDRIVDALDAGGSGDMYAGLNAEERAALEEVTKMGFPPRAWFAHERVSIGYTGVLAAIIFYLLNGDPQYVRDFWSQEGYLGRNPSAALRNARVQHNASLGSLITSAQAREMGLPVSIAAGTRDEAPSAFRIAGLPNKRLQGSYVTVRSGAASGQSVMITGVVNDVVMIGFQDSQIAALTQVRPGDQLEIDNSVYLAAQYFHRHQMPPQEFYVWDQFKNADGSPKYVQRPLLPSYATPEVRDRVQSGRFSCKMLVISCLMDEAAYPWQADWYRNKVRDVRGAAINEHYRLYYLDNAMHVSPGSYLEIAEGGNVNRSYTPVETRIVSYASALQQGLRDLAAWVERGVEPRQGSVYTVGQGQVTIPERAADRKGLQPSVHVTANGGARANVRAGQAVSLSGVIEAAAGTGSVVAAEWDFDGTGAFSEKEQVTAAGQVTVARSHTYARPGTYFAVLRGIVQAPDAVGTPYAKVMNLGRVRVVVS